MEKVSLKRIIKILLIILPFFIVLNIIILSLLGFDFPLKVQTANFLRSSSIFISKITCTLQGKTPTYLGPNGWVCPVNCQNGYRLPKSDIGPPTDTLWPPCHCKGEWVNEICKY